ncbi:MAG TPA: septum formation initiator family protein [Acidimicrobiales bacterium]|nr:septum formation initiator family protein [Acidimicrobiales bacterium]
MAVGLAVSFVLMLVLLVGVFPTRQWWAQRDELGQRREELARQQDESEQLEQRIATLRTEEEVERLAREEFGMVRPGEEAYQILPPPVAPVDLPDTWPFTGADDWLNR